MSQPPCHYRVSVKALVSSCDQVLLVREGSERWDLPGGGLEHNEDVGIGLSRELEEELGVATKSPPELLCSYKAFDPVNDRYVLALIFAVELSSWEFVLKPPVFEIRTFNKTELQRVPLEPYAEALRPLLVGESLPVN